jgi:hypothetical protein
MADACRSLYLACIHCRFDEVDLQRRFLSFPGLLFLRGDFQDQLSSVLLQGISWGEPSNGGMGSRLHFALFNDLGDLLSVRISWGESSKINYAVLN